MVSRVKKRKRKIPLVKKSSSDYKREFIIKGIYLSMKILSGLKTLNDFKILFSKAKDDLSEEDKEKLELIFKEMIRIIREKGFFTIIQWIIFKPILIYDTIKSLLEYKKPITSEMMTGSIFETMMMYYKNADLDNDKISNVMQPSI